MRILTLENGQDIDYRSNSLFILKDDNKELYYLKAVNSFNDRTIILYESESSTELEIKMKNIALAYEKNQQVYCID